MTVFESGGMVVSLRTLIASGWSPTHTTYTAYLLDLVPRNARAHGIQLIAEVDEVELQVHDLLFVYCII